MKSASHAAMQEALRRRRSQGLDLTIIVGDPGDKDKQEDKELGHAPEATLLDDGDEANELTGRAGEDGNPADAHGLLPDGDPMMKGDPEDEKMMIERELSKSSLLGRGGIFRRNMGKKPAMK